MLEKGRVIIIMIITLLVIIDHSWVEARGAMPDMPLVLVRARASEPIFMEGIEIPERQILDTPDLCSHTMQAPGLLVD